MRKKVKAAQKATQSPDEISAEAYTLCCRRLLDNEDFKIVRSVQLAKRIKIIETGKAKPTEAQWSFLAGFDEAFMEPFNAAARTLSDDHKNQLAESLQATLRG